MTRSWKQGIDLTSRASSITPLEANEESEIIFFFHSTDLKNALFCPRDRKSMPRELLQTDHRMSYPLATAFSRGSTPRLILSSFPQTLRVYDSRKQPARICANCHKRTLFTSLKWASSPG